MISFTPEADPLHLELNAIGLAGFLAEELGVVVEAQVDADYAATVEAMNAGHVHIATNLAPLQAALAVDRAGARLILAEERDGRAYYAFLAPNLAACANSRPSTRQRRPATT